MVLLLMFLFPTGQLFDGFDDDYQCPVLDEDRVSKSQYITPPSGVFNSNVLNSNKLKHFWPIV